MTRMFNAHLKKFLGAKYERIPKTCVLWAVLLFTLRTAEIRLDFAPAVIWLTTICVTAGGFVQVLSSDDMVDNLRGHLMLPETMVHFHAAYFLSVAVYTFLTKTGLLLIAYVALSTVKSSTIIGFILCFFMSGAIVYPLAFRTEKKLTAYRYARGARHHFTVYLMRYLWNNKNYLVNTVILWVFGCVFAVFMSKSGFQNMLPLGFALMCLNTPLGILLSSDTALYRQVRFLPGSFTGVLLPYALFVTVVNVVACLIYLSAWYFITGETAAIMVVIAVLFSMLSAALTVTLEMKFPLLCWKVESDLWHHPRKYIVPAIMALLASFVMILMGGF